MKRFYIVFIIFVIIFSLFFWSKTKLNTKADVTLVFTAYDQNIEVVLSSKESEQVIDILNKKHYSVGDGILYCGFSKDVALKVGNRTFAIAQDTCNYVQDYKNLRYIRLSEEEITYIHELFGKYGGYFPCV